MKNIYLLSNQTKTSVSRRIDSVSLPSRCRVMPIILLFLTAFSLHAWGAEDDAHDFAQNISQLLNNNNAISSINIADQGYPIKSIEITCKYNKSTNPAVTIEVLVGGASYATNQDVGNNFNSTKIFNGNASGAVQINFKNRTGSGTGHGTFYVTNVRLIEGASASCANEVTITKGAETNGTYTLSATSICGDAPGGTVNISDITPASGYEFDEITTSASGTVDNTNKRVTGITANTTITVKFKALPTYAIRFFDSGVQVGSTQNIVSGGTATPPSDPAGCAEFTFLGWWTSELADDNTTSYTWVTDFTVTGNQNYYAVYSHPSPTSSIVTLNPTIDTSFPKDGIKLSVSSGTLTNGTDYRVVNLPPL